MILWGTKEGFNAECRHRANRCGYGTGGWTTKEAIVIAYDGEI